MGNPNIAVSCEPRRAAREGDPARDLRLLGARCRLPDSFEVRRKPTKTCTSRRVFAAARFLWLLVTFAIASGFAAASAAETEKPQQAKASGIVDWATVPVRAVTLFYPGQSSFQWLRGPGHAAGRAAVADGAPCSACHAGQEAALGERIVAGGTLEPDPIAGKPGAIELRVQAAYDQERLYLRFQWSTRQERPGQVHDFLRYDGQRWKPFGGPRSKPEVRSGAMPPLYEDRLGITLDDGRVPSFAAQGCWLSCHDGMRDMQRQPSAERVRAHGLLGRLLGRDDVRKYLPESRSDEAASWDRTKSAEDIARLKAAGAFLDLMQWRAYRSNPVGMADDGYVLEYRLFDDGVGSFASNLDRETTAPRYMFDRARTGYRALDLEQIVGRSESFALIREENAVPYEPEADWRAGDILPSRVLTRDGTRGSAADNLDVVGSWEQGTWTVVWARALDTGHPGDDKPLRAGGRYTVSFSVHDDNVTTRFHHVSFPLTLGIGVNADLTAVKVE